jgi:predicted ribosomally synthesized peptide with SipW-like signal peptide
VLSLREGLGTNALFPLNLYGLNKKRFLKGEIMSKINKLGKSTFVIAILSFLLVAVLGFGGTYAYFSASTKTDASATIAMGHLHISEAAAFASTAELVTEDEVAVPNQKIIDGDVEVTVTSNIAYYIRATFTSEVTFKGTHAQTEQTACPDADDVLTMALGDGWEEGKSVAATADDPATRYFYKLAPQAVTAESGDKLTFSVSVTVPSTVGENESKHWMDAEITVTVAFEVVQADYLGNIGEAKTYQSATEVEAAWDAAGLPIGTVAAA